MYTCVNTESKVVTSRVSETEHVTCKIDAAIITVIDAYLFIYLFIPICMLEKRQKCAETRFGCCPDGKTIAPAADYSGCPGTYNVVDPEVSTLKQFHCSIDDSGLNSFCSVL